MKSWKIGALAGLIAGIVFGIAEFVHGLIVIDIGFGHWGIQTLTTEVIRRIAFVELTIGIIWWIIFGLFYVKLYDLIPGKGILKGFVYSLGFYLIYNVRWASHQLFYSQITSVITFLLPFHGYILGGLVLGASYEYLSNKYSVTKYESKIYKNDLVKGIYAGAFGGLAMGVVIFFNNFLFYNPRVYPSLVADIGFLVGQLGTHMFFNMIWCAFFGVLFVKLYERIPSKGVLKGLIFSMIIFFFTTFFSAIYSLAYGQITWFIIMLLAGLGFLAFGLVLGYLYKK